MVQLAPLPSRQTVRMSANFRKHTLQCYCITHHKQDFKCRHNFLLLQGVIWCCIDVIVFMAGPLILSNLQQTGAAVTAYVCLQPPSPCVSMCPACCGHTQPASCTIKPQLPFPCQPPRPLHLIVTSAITTDGQSFMCPSGSTGTTPQASPGLVQRAPLRHANKRVMSLLCLFSMAATT